MSPLIDDSQIHVILLDIEGTTTPVDFVYKTLFPYARHRVESFIREHYRDSETQALLAELRSQHEREESDEAKPPSWHDQTDDTRIQSVVKYVHSLMDRDRKCTALKTLQGKIWQEGYERGELHGQVYADVPAAFARWRAQGREICIYSSGSELAQQLLFRSTAAGDLTAYVSAYFDTRIGAKTEADSYMKIAESLHRKSNEVLFISDAVKEIDAARLASMQTLLCMRDTTAPVVASAGKIVSTFDEVLPG